MHSSRLLIIAGAAVTALALALPHVSSSLLGAVDGLEGAAWPAAAVLALPAFVAFLGDRREGFGPLPALLAVVAGALASVFAVAKLIDAALAARDIRLVAGSAGIGIGAWMLLAGCLVALTGAVMSLSRRVR